MVKIKLFKTRDKAKRFAERVEGELYYYGPRSKTREDYIEELECYEGTFDETSARLFPYCVSYFDKEESTQ